MTEPVSLAAVTRRYRRVTALEGIDLVVRADEVLAVVGPSGCGKSTLLELVAGLQEPDAGRCRCWGATDAASRRERLRVHAAARPPASLARRPRQRRARAGVPGRAALGGAPPRGAAVRALRARGLRGRPAGRAVRRDAPARRLPAHPSAGPAGAAPRRALRRARLAHALVDAALAGRRPRPGAAHRPAGDARRRGGGLPGRPDRGAVAATGPRGGRDPRGARGAARRDQPRVRRASSAASWRRSACEVPASPRSCSPCSCSRGRAWRRSTRWTT